MNELANAFAKSLEDEAFRREPKTGGDGTYNRDEHNNYVAAVALRYAAREVRAYGRLLEESRELRAMTKVERIGLGSST